MALRNLPARWPRSHRFRATLDARGVLRACCALQLGRRPQLALFPGVDARRPQAGDRLRWRRRRLPEDLLARRPTGRPSDLRTEVRRHEPRPARRAVPRGTTGRRCCLCAVPANGEVRASGVVPYASSSPARGRPSTTCRELAATSICWNRATTTQRRRAAGCNASGSTTTCWVIAVSVRPFGARAGSGGTRPPTCRRDAETSLPTTRQCC